DIETEEYPCYPTPPGASPRLTLMPETGSTRSFSTIQWANGAPGARAKTLSKGSGWHGRRRSNDVFEHERRRSTRFKAPRLHSLCDNKDVWLARRSARALDPGRPLASPYQQHHIRLDHHSTGLSRSGPLLYDQWLFDRDSSLA